MRIFHMLWLPFAYWFFPYRLANNALRGTLKQYGVNLATIPQELTQEIATNTIKSQKLFARKPSVFKQLYDLQLLTDFNAITMKKVINGEYRYEHEITPEVERVRSIMLKHAARILQKK